MPGLVEEFRMFRLGTSPPVLLAPPASGSLSGASLERLLGPPSPNLLEAMRRDHCASADSFIYFQSPNYDVSTTSQIEWLFVADPDTALTIRDSTISGCASSVSHHECSCSDRGE